MSEAAASRPGLSDWLSLVRFSHSVFALPFAGIALLVASDGLPAPRLIGLVLVAMVAARTAAMAYNRFADRDVDAANPRTADREIPRGAVAPRQALALAVAASAVFVLVAFVIQPICGLLAFPVLAVLLGYSHAKRFTSFTQLWLGFALGLSPLGAWVAVRGQLDESLADPAVLTLGVTLWVAGFDALYAIQDEAFDRANGLRSLVTWVGSGAVKVLAVALHAAGVAAFVWFGMRVGFGAWWQTGVAVCALGIAAIHALAATGRFARAGQAFFMANAGVPVVLFGACLAELFG